MIKLFRISSFLFRLNLSFLAKIFYYLIYLIFNSSVPPSVKIGQNSKFAYGGIGIVLHAQTKIGDNCIIGQGITIGGRSKHKDVPDIGNNVYMGAGCRILGPIKIGDHVIIAPNSVVIHDIPSNSIVAGIPAKVIKKCKNISDFV